MDITHYSFAFFVFVLLCALILIYARLSRGKKKDDSGSFEKEQRLFKLYQNIEDMLASFEEYAEEAKKELSRGIEQVNALIEQAQSEPAKACAEPEASPSPKIIAKSNAHGQDHADLKPEERIPLLVERGMSKSEIAKELGLTIREVTLIMDIKKISNPEDKS